MKNKGGGVLWLSRNPGKIILPDAHVMTRDHPAMADSTSISLAAARCLEGLNWNSSATHEQETSASGPHFSYNPPGRGLPAPTLELRGGMCDVERQVRSDRDWLWPRR